MAHRLSDSIELNNPRGSGEGYGRTISHEGSDDELLEAWFHGARLTTSIFASGVDNKPRAVLVTVISFLDRNFSHGPISMDH